MSDKGIIFSAPMVRALLDGRKTQTRRLLNPQPQFLTGRGKRIYADADYKKSWIDDSDGDLPFKIGQHLYVREAHSLVGSFDPQLVVTRADYPDCVPSQYENIPPASDLKWRPSIHMRRCDSRLTLAVWRIDVQRLQEITETDARAEGVPMVVDRSYQHGFALLWNSLHGSSGTRWDDNPYVIKVSFDVEHRNIDGVPTL